MPGSQSISLRQIRRRNISVSNKPLRNVVKPTRNRWGKTVLVWIGILTFTLPIFRSGLKSNLTLFEFTLNHTIFGDVVEFIPKEDYKEAFDDTL